MKKSRKTKLHILLLIFSFFPFLILLPLTFLRKYDIDPHFLNSNITIYRHPILHQNDFPPTLLTRFLLRKPVPYLSNFEPVYVNGSSKYQLSISCLYESPVLLTINNTIVSTENVYYINNSIYIADIQCHPRFWHWNSSQHDRLYVQYIHVDSVIAIGHQHSSDFGHWLLETLPAFVAIPKQIRDKSYLLLPSLPYHAENSLKFFGFNISHVIYGENQYVYANKIYSIYSHYCGTLNQWLLANFRSQVILRLNIDQEKPTLCVLFNRNKGQSRFLSNFDDIIKALSIRFPNETFQKGVFYTSFEQQVFYFNKMKLVFAVHGSVLSNIIFMQDKTIVIELQMEKILPSFFYASILTGKNLICCRDRNISYRSKLPNTANISTIIEAFSYAYPS